MKLALFMSCATALRLAPTMVQQPRRAVLAGGAAAAGSLILPARAKKPLCLPGTNSAKALGGPGYTIGILEHDTPSFAAQGPRGLRLRPAVRLPAGVQNNRSILHQVAVDGDRQGRRAVWPRLRDVGPEGRKKILRQRQGAELRAGPQGRLAYGQVARELLRVRRGVRISTPARTTRAAQVLRLPRARARPAPTVPEGLGHQRARGVRPAPSTPPTRRLLRRPRLGVPYKDWLKLFGSPDIDALHESLNILYSVCGPVNGKVSTDLTGGGVGVLHVHKSYKDALRFDATFQDIKEKVKADGILKEPSRSALRLRPKSMARS